MTADLASGRELLDDLAELVGSESPSADVAALARCADVVDTLGRRRIGATAERIHVGDRVHLRWQLGRPRVVLLGHFDTVWPVGTLARWPFEVDGDRVTGPGTFDMKAGLVQLFAALQSLTDLDGVAVLTTSDEEIGSTTSQQLIEDTCRDARAVLVLEPSADGAVKIARKGVGMFTLEITGRAAHAGLEPENGINATIEAAHQVLAAAALGRPASGTTVTPTVVTAGTTANTVPAAARVAVDVRAASAAEMQRVESALQSLTPQLPGAGVKLVTHSVRLPLESEMSADLFGRAQRHASDLGLPALAGVAVGGGSDGNLTAALGVPTLDGLGAVGGNAHAEGEWVSVASMPQRTALVAALVRDLLEETR
ncbi:MAG TPA: M20/M25/M40 family metallo-hydrolase [Mycobacteriales bacterium]|nr:M20/M25/M40 family metallo-hydrolase [Mycobacteriales bacterium]